VVPAGPSSVAPPQPPQARPDRCGHPRPVANRIQRAGGPPVSGTSVLRVQVQELTPGLVDAVAVVRRGQRAVFMARGWRPCRAAGSSSSSSTG